MPTYLTSEHMTVTKIDNKIKYHTKVASYTRIQLDKSIQEREKKPPGINIIHESIRVALLNMAFIDIPVVPEELLSRFDGCPAYKSKIDPSSSKSSSADREYGSADEDGNGGATEREHFMDSRD
ncbi:MAG: hypothetical protein Q9172_003463 [Xanthocarpia lactea]